MSGDEARGTAGWRKWINRHLHGKVSAQRIQRRMREAGIDPGTVNQMIATVAEEKERRCRKTAALRFGAGAVILLIPIAAIAAAAMTGWIPKIRSLFAIGATALVGVGFIGRGLWWRRRAAVLADPVGGSSLPRHTHRSVGAPLLEGELLQVRSKHLNSLDLAEVQDVLHAFFRCPSCDRKTSRIVILGGNLFDILNDPTRLSTVLAVEPERFLPDLGSEKCDGPHATPLVLTHVILCRTNPRSRNNLHLIVQYEADGMASPLRVAVLEKNGAYSLLSEKDSLKLLGFPSHASRH